jgi:hypothetical protein
MTLKHFVITVSGIASIATASAGTCPPPPSSVDPSLMARVSYNKKTGNYTYSYTISNGRDSVLPLSYFTLLTSVSLSELRAPSGWMAKYIDTPHLPPNLRWAAFPKKGGSSPTDSEALILPGLINPGKSLSGFSFESSQPPGIQQYYIKGFTQIPSSTPTLADDEAPPQCPGWDFSSPLLKTFVTGLTTGPAAPDTLSVAIRLREEGGTHHCKPIDPNNPSGKVSILVLSSKTFDASDIVVSSIKFGPGGAAPISSKIIPSGTEEVDSDEQEEWEKQRSNIDSCLKRDKRRKNLLLTFDLQSLAIQCVLDKALFLSGKTQSGESIVGAVSSKTVGCDLRAPGARHLRDRAKEGLFSGIQKIQGNAQKNR